jgi:hypothetical protein
LKDYFRPIVNIRPRESSGPKILQSQRLTDDRVIENDHVFDVAAKCGFNFSPRPYSITGHWNSARRSERVFYAGILCYGYSGKKGL